MNCTACGSTNEASARLCRRCRAPLEAEPADDSPITARGRSEGGRLETTLRGGRDAADPGLACPDCAEGTDPSWRFCKHCGHELSRAPRSFGETAPLGVRLRPAPPDLDANRHLLLQLDEDGLAVVATHALPQGQTIIGRTTGDLVLPDDAALSGRHAVFEVQGESCLVRDLGSTNGTFISVEGSEPLFPHAVLLLGSQRLIFEEGSEGRPDELLQSLPLGREGRRVTLGSDHVVIGKGRHADVAFPEDRYLSRKHAEIVRTRRGAVVRDLGSTNGTFVLVPEERTLRDGDRLVIGERLFEYRLEPAV